MCGIIGYVGSREAEPVLLEGLRRLEYRGYDSAGVATLTGAVSCSGRASRAACAAWCEEARGGRR
jgi:glutamine---fructose-6-phosphate transaminase (isomerizing)